MALWDTFLNVTLTPLAFVFLLFALPPLSIWKAFKWFAAWVTPEDVRGKVVLITGASSGIGEHMAYEYGKLGARLVLVARREEALQAVAEKATTLGATDVHVAAGDVTSEEDCKRVVDATIQKYGHLDHLVNNAGSLNSFFFRDSVGTKALHATVDSNFWGPINMTKFALPHLRETHGKILVTSSIGAYMPHPREAIYNGAKAGVHQFFDTLRNEERGIVTITILMPGMTESEITGGKLIGEKGDITQEIPRRDAHFGTQPMAYPSKVAQDAVYAMRRGYRYVISPYLYTMFLLYRLAAPELIDWMFYFQAVKNPENPANKTTLEQNPALYKAVYTEGARKVD